MSLCRYRIVKLVFFNSSKVSHNTQITILNVKDLLPVEWKTNCDPYVKIRFVPHEHFKQTERYQTKSKLKTTCALFDETFTV